MCKQNTFICVVAEIKKTFADVSKKYQIPADMNPLPVRYEPAIRIKRS